MLHKYVRNLLLHMIKCRLKYLSFTFSIGRHHHICSINRSKIINRIISVITTSATSPTTSSTVFTTTSICLLVVIIILDCGPNVHVSIINVIVLLCFLIYVNVLK